MHIDSLKSYGNGLVVNIQKTIDNICTYLKENKLSVGKGIRMDKTSAGTVLSLAPQENRGGGTTIITTSAPPVVADTEMYGEFTPFVKDGWLIIMYKTTPISSIDVTKLKATDSAGWLVAGPRIF